MQSCRETRRPSSLENLRLRSSACWSAVAGGLAGFDIEGVICHPNLLDLSLIADTIFRRLNTGYACRFGRLVGFPYGPLRRRHVGGQLLLELVMHPADAGERLISLFGGRRSIAEVPSDAEKILCSLSLVFDHQRQLSGLIGGKRLFTVRQYTCDLLHQLVDRILLRQLPKGGRRE